jgi:hypothetical protein
MDREQWEKAAAHFVVSNFNTDPSDLLDFASTFSLYDQSTDPAVRALVSERFPECQVVDNTGHSLSNYFRYLLDHWETMPSLLALLKSNVVGRHVSREYFERNYRNQHYTFIYDEGPFAPGPAASLLFESAFLELNNSWYSGAKPRRYFATYNQFLEFIYVRPVLPRWILFSPGACYIVPRENIRRHPRALFEALQHLVTYQFFPTEAYFVERALHTVFTSNAMLQPYMHNSDLMREALERLPDRSAELPPRAPLSRRIAYRLSSSSLASARIKSRPRGRN